MKRFASYAIVVVLLAGSFWLGRLVVHNHSTHALHAGSASATLPERILAVRPDGAPTTLRIEHPEPTLLLVLSTDCPFCGDNLPNWVRLTERIQEMDGGHRVLALSVSSRQETAEYLERHDLKVPYLLIHPAELRTMGFQGVPTTVALVPDSRTARSWSGVMSPEDVEAVLDWAETATRSNAETTASAEVPAPPDGEIDN